MLALWGPAALLLLSASGLQSPPQDPAPVPIVGGTDVEACEFPATVAVLNGGGTPFCTGILVHPRVVLLAAHCLGNQLPFSVGFGEAVAEPEQTVAVAGCVAHPDYVPGFDAELNELDVAYCELSEDAPDVPIVPPLMGCEAEQLVPDAEVTLVGFGLDNEESGTGNTRKRRTVNTIEVVDEPANDLILLGVEDSSACFGDSGGPAYMQLSDGSWRVVGITSEAHPDVADLPLVCGYGVVYELVHLQMTWFEEASGYDLTPCFDADGTWNPGADCGGFPLSLEDGGDWIDACATRSLSPDSSTCGDPFDGVGTSTGGETDSATDTEGPTGGSETTGGVGTTGTLSGGTAAGSSGGGAESSSTTAPDGGPTTLGFTSTTEAAESSGSGPGGDGGGAGCGCRSPRTEPGAWLLMLIGLAATRRRS